MCTRKYVAVCAFGCVGLLLLGGCLFTDARTNNQGGSNPIQVASKLSADRLDTFNPDDVQVLADLARQAAGLDLPPVTDEQAAAVVQFFADNDIQTQEDLEQVFQDWQDDPNSVVLSDDVRAVIEAFVETGASVDINNLGI